ncbi:uncharacterized protein LOC114959009 [Acropora millepora]|uniref:uncharacterized protein LOC114959009 n=1 Tax=Acropora millepora TaxID=45264 RepID=UPI001CF1AB16|nr:uncharacterized protein LOC114959009 [Acropora millepora]
MSETSEASTPSSVTGETSSSQETSQTGNPQSGQMATAAGNFNIPPPANFNPKTEDWNQWISRYELFEAATQRDGLPDKVRINTLLYVMGNNAVDIYQSFKLSSEGNTYTNVKQKFKEHFKGKVALVFERTQFVRRLQQEKEGVMSFIEDLQKRADICSFGDLRDQMVYTQIVAGLRDSQLRRRLMANENLTLDQVIAEAKSAEITKQQDQILQSNPTAADLSKIKDIHDKFKNGKNGKDDDRSKRNVQKPCYKCGAQPSHPPNRCPAKNVTCSACKKKGHFAKVCKSSKRVQSVDEDSSEDDVSVMTIGEAVNMVENNSKWKTNVLIRNHNVKFKIDTGADVTVIPEDIFRRFKLGRLQSTSKKLCGADQKGLCVMGEIREKLTLGETCVTEDIYVIKGLKEPLLGRPAIEKLNLFARINDIRSPCSDEQIKKKYPQLFHGLGELEGEYEIQLTPNAQPFAITSP